MPFVTSSFTLDCNSFIINKTNRFACEKNHWKLEIVTSVVLLAQLLFPAVILLVEGLNSEKIWFKIIHLNLKFRS